MRQQDDNDFTMLATVRDFMNGHSAETTGVSAMATVMTALTALIAQIDAAGTAQASPLTGIATQTLSNAGWAGATVEFRTKAVDAAAHEVFSAVVPASF